MSEPTRRVGLLTLGTSTRELAELVTGLHPTLGSRLSHLHLETSEGSSPVRRPENVTLPLPSSAALVEHLAAAWRRGDTEPLTRVLPAGWHEGPDHWPGVRHHIQRNALRVPHTSCAVS